MQNDNLLNAVIKNYAGVREFEELFQLIQAIDETDRIEAKVATHALGNSFLEVVSAFSNEPDLGGGYIILGLERNEFGVDPRYRVSGVADPDDLQRQISSACCQAFNIIIRPSIKVLMHSQETIILVSIEEAKPHQKPVFIKKLGREDGAFRRIGSSNQVCTSDDLNLLYQLRSEPKHDHMCIEDASWEDFDSAAIDFYRTERKHIKKDAHELQYNNQDLLKALQAVKTEHGGTFPTVAGILLFGTTIALRRLFPFASRIEYLLVEGREWMSDPDRRYVAVDLQESLITALPRILNQIMTDIRQVFALEEDQLHRKDNPIIPRKVIREAVVNSLMHRDYRIASAIQIIKYANRIEFRNPGYSLKPDVRIGFPGSIIRNEIISRVFQDINFSESKGTGMGSMREEMKRANLTVPLIESQRSRNLFVLTLIPHQLFDDNDRIWLGNFEELNLSDEESRALIVLREMGAITNEDYRTINAVDSFSASYHLRRLVDFELIESKGRGPATYYVPARKLLEPYSYFHAQRSGEINYLSGKLPGKLPGKLSEELIEELKKIDKDHSFDLTCGVIKELCSYRPLKAREIAHLLKKNLSHVKEYYLTPLLELRDLELLYPDNPTHPNQAYKTKQKLVVEKANE